MARIGRFVLTCYAVAFYIFLYAPIALLLVLSLNDAPVVGLPLRGITLKWYWFVIGNGQLFGALANSLVLGIVSAAIATLLALFMALGMRRQFPLKQLAMQLVLVPVVVPGVVGGIMLLICFGYLGISMDLWTTVLAAHVTWVLPFAFLMLYPRISTFDRALEDAAMDLGATPRVVFFKVLLPMLQPAITATMLFSFTLSFDEFIRTLFVLGPQRTVPVQLWSLISEQVTPYLPAVGVIIMLVSIGVSIVGFWLTSRSATQA
jgi:ABC-type spermidine/putrescine transport system permease subunit II